jgi:hypothetical protein
VILLCEILTIAPRDSRRIHLSVVPPFYSPRGERAIQLSRDFIGAAIRIPRFLGYSRSANCSFLAEIGHSSMPARQYDRGAILSPEGKRKMQRRTVELRDADNDYAWAREPRRPHAAINDLMAVDRRHACRRATAAWRCRMAMAS